MKTEDFGKAGVSVLATGVGAGVSRILAEKIPVANAKIKHGALAAVSILGAALVGRKDSTNAFLQDVAIGSSATQIFMMAKSFIGEPEGLIKTALGSPKRKTFLANPRRNFMPMGIVSRNAPSSPMALNGLKEGKQIIFQSI